MKFEGEYFNAIRWNGKGYNKNGEEEFEIKNGNGFEKEYDDNNKLIFEGEFENWMRKGKGKEYYSNLKLFDEDFFDKEIIKGKRFYYFSDILEEGDI